MVVADGTGIPLAFSTHSSKRAEVKLEADVVDQAQYPEVATQLIADKRYESEVLRDELAKFCSFPHIDRIANAHPVRMAEGCDNTRADGSSKERSPGSDSFARWLCTTNTTVGSIKLLQT